MWCDYNVVSPKIGLFKQTFKRNNRNSIKRDIFPSHIHRLRLAINIMKKRSWNNQPANFENWPFKFLNGRNKKIENTHLVTCAEIYIRNSSFDVRETRQSDRENIFFFYFVQMRSQCVCVLMFFFSQFSMQSTFCFPTSRKTMRPLSYDQLFRVSNIDYNSLAKNRISSGTNSAACARALSSRAFLG